MAVQGYSASSFSVVAYLHDTTPITLLDGVPQVGTVNSSVANQYAFDVPAGGVSVEITLIPTSGDPDLYVSMNSSVVPSSGAYDFRSVSAFGNDVIVIQPTDPKFTNNNCQNGCKIKIAVVGFQSRCVWLAPIATIASPARPFLLCPCGWHVSLSFMFVLGC